MSPSPQIDVNVVIENVEARLVEMRASHLLAMAMPTLLPTPWPERAGRGFHAGGHVRFGMAGSLAVELAKFLEVVERDGGLAR